MMLAWIAVRHAHKVWVSGAAPGVQCKEQHRHSSFVMQLLTGVQDSPYSVHDRACRQCREARLSTSQAVCAVHARHPHKESIPDAGKAALGPPEQTVPLPGQQRAVGLNPKP